MYQLLELSALFAVLIPICIGGAKFKVVSTEAKVFFFFLVFSFLFDSIYTYLAYQYINNLWLSHLYTPVEFLFFCYLIGSNFRNTGFKIVLKIISVAFILIWILNHLFLEDFSQFDSLSTSISNVLLVIFACLLLHETAKDELDYPLYYKKEFWLAFGIIVYFGTVVTLFASLNYLIVIPDIDAQKLWIIVHSPVSILTKIIFSFIFLCRR